MKYCIYGSSGYMWGILSAGQLGVSADIYNKRIKAINLHKFRVTTVNGAAEVEHTGCVARCSGLGSLTYG